MVGAAPALVFGVIYSVACWRAQKRLDEQIERIATRGEPVWFSDLAARANDPALGRGRAVVALLETIQTLPRRPEPGSGESLSTQEQADVRAAVRHNRPKCRELARLARLGDCRFENDFQAVVPGEAAVPAAGNLIHVHHSLLYDAEDALSRADYPRVTNAIQQLFEIAELLRCEPSYVSQFVRIRIAGGGLDVLQTLLGRITLSESESEAVDQQLNRLELSFRLAGATHAERAMILTTLENLGRPEMGDFLESLARISDQSQVVPNAYWKNRWWGSWLYRPRRLHEQTVMLQTLSRFAELIDKPGPVASAELAAANARFRAQSNDLPACASFIMNPKQIRGQALAYRQRLIAARLGLTICRYRADHGDLPGSLDEISASTEISLLGLSSGAPLVYEKSDSNFAIYDESPKQGRFAVAFDPSHGKE